MEINIKIQFSEGAVRRVSFVLSIVGALVRLLKGKASWAAVEVAAPKDGQA